MSLMGFCILRAEYLCRSRITWPSYVRLTTVAIVWFAWAVAGIEQTAVAQQRLAKDVYGVGILGNCCTHGARICAMFKARGDTKVVAAYESNPRRAKELSDALGAPLADSYDAVLEDPEVDFVAVTCDPCDKAAMIAKAARLGKHVFLNKPPCESLDSARQIAQAVHEHPVWLVHDIPMVRFVPVYARLLKGVRDRPYGKVLGYHHLFGMNFDPAFDLQGTWPERLDPPARSGGGEMTNMGCYAIDFAVAMLGKPKAVTAKCRKEWDVYRQAGVENFGQIVLDYGDFFAFLEVGKQQLVGPLQHSNQLTVNFEHKTLLIDANANVVTINHVPVSWEEFSQGAAAVGSVEQLLLAMREGKPPTSGVESIVDATEVLMAAYESIVQGGRPIALPLASGENPLARSTNRP
jgi:predicted dehydrogenase